MPYLILILCVFTLACSPTPIFEKSYNFENNLWTYQDATHFSFDSPDTTKKYDLIFDIIHGKDYSYENLYIKLLTTFPNKDTITDEISIPLITEDGHWVGRGNSEKKVRVYLQQGLKFQHEGRYNITISQHSREKELVGIHAVSLAIYPFAEG